MKSLLKTYRTHGLHYGSFRAFLEAEYPNIPLKPIAIEGVKVA